MSRFRNGFSVSVIIQPRGISAMDKDILKTAVVLRHRLHRCAELSGQEKQTKAMLIDFLRTHTSLELHDMGAWFYAVYKAPLNARTESAPMRRIAFRADFDALPIEDDPALPYASENRGVAHKCGHDGHSAALCALAAEIDRHGCRSDILFLFQHAEETGCGAPVCQKMITDEKPDIIFGWHNMPGFPAGSVAVHDGTAAFASRGLVLSFFGKSSHASQPENGHNPARAISKLIIDIPELTAREDHRGIVMATVVCVRIGEEAFGTNAGFGQLMLTIRAEFESELDALDAEICARARTYARQDGITNVEVQYRDSFPETRNTPDAVAAVRKARLECGLPEARWDEPFRSSEDFGCYTKLTSGALFYIGCGTRHAKLHTREYDFNDEIIEPAVDMMFRLAQDA